MSENVTHKDAEQQSGQRTIVAFIVGLLIGGLVVWMFSGDAAQDSTPTDQEQAEDQSEVDTATTTESNNDVSDEAQPETTTGASTESESTIEMEVGEGSVSLSDQPASSRITLDSVTFPMSDGWIGVREYMNGNLGALLGVVRFSESQGLVPQEIILQRSTTVGREYAVVFYTPSEDNQFNLGVNSQLDGIFATFVAQ